MKRLFTIALLLLAVNAWAAPIIVPGSYAQGDAAYKLGGEHAVIILRGTATFTVDDAIDSANTGWFQVGLSDSNTSTENTNRLNFASDIMNLVIALSTNGDSIGLSQIRVEFSYDNTDYMPIRNADSTFLMMNTGNYNSPLYAGNGGWLYETPFASAHGQAIAATTYDNFRWRYKICLQGVAWCRITFLSADDVADNVTVTYTVELMH